MTYGDQGYRFRGEGFRDEPDFRADTGSSPTYQPGGYSSPSTLDTTRAGTDSGGVTADELDDVFDDPDHGDPGMDRMGVHMLWELLLLIATIGMAAYFRQTHHAQFSGTNLRNLLLDATVLGFLATGVGLSLRAGVVNLAAGPIASATALFFATHTDRGLVATAGVALLLAMAVGLCTGLLVVVLHVPGWAASLGAALTVVIWINKHVAAAPIVASYHPDKQAFYWYGGFAALALLGGVLGLVKPVRRGVGRFRPVADPAIRRGVLAGGMAVLALIGSSLLAGLAGVLMALSSPTVAPSDGFLTTGLALGAALAAGTSAFGRRGGVLGTVLSATLITLVMAYSDAAHLRISPYAVAAVAVGAGLVLTRLVERFGRPPANRKPQPEPDSTGWDVGTRVTDSRTADTGSQSWTGARQGGWTSQLPAQSTDDTWGGASDERWGVK